MTDDAHDTLTCMIVDVASHPNVASQTCLHERVAGGTVVHGEGGP